MLDRYGFDAAFGGARRDEEKSRAPRSGFSRFRDSNQADPKNQRPELWKHYNTRKYKGETMRVFPLSNWTELDVWQYILREKSRSSALLRRRAADRGAGRHAIMVDDERMPLAAGRRPGGARVRFRTLGCYPLSGAVESMRGPCDEIIVEMRARRVRTAGR